MKYLLTLFLIVSCQNQESSEPLKFVQKNNQNNDQAIEIYDVKESTPDPLYDAINTLNPDLIQESLNRFGSGSGSKYEQTGGSAITHFLIASAESEIDKATIVQRFIDQGIDPDLKTPLGLSPLSIAIQNNEVPVVEVLVKNGANKDEILRDGQTLLELAKSLDRVEIISLLQ